MKFERTQYDVGVIVGRFQVPALHPAHLDLIKTVVQNSTRAVVLLGVAPTKLTRRNPLDYESRSRMITAAFPSVCIHPIHDTPDDESWSQNLDRLIFTYVLHPGETACLYGGRESFLSHYSGKLPTQALSSDTKMSGSEIRRKFMSTIGDSEAFRHGVCYAADVMYPRCMPTVDVAILSEDRSRILLGRKPDEKRFRLIGGFAEPNSPSFEADARREVREETGLDITDPKYLGSAMIDDWRYAGEVDKIKTLLFEATVQSGSEEPGDDIAELKWFDLKNLDLLKVIPAHHPLFTLL